MRTIIKSLIQLTSLLLATAQCSQQVPVLEANKVKLIEVGAGAAQLFHSRGILGEACQPYRVDRQVPSGHMTELNASDADVYLRAKLFASTEKVLTARGIVQNIRMLSSPSPEQLDVSIRNGNPLAVYTKHFITTIARPGQLSYEQSQKGYRYYLTIRQARANIDCKGCALPLLGNDLPLQEQVNLIKGWSLSGLPIVVTRVGEIPSTHRLYAICDYGRRAGNTAMGRIARTYAHWYAHNIVAGKTVQDPLVRFGIGLAAVVGVVTGVGVAAKLLHAKKHAAKKAAQVVLQENALEAELVAAE
jgi:hypothetical protein